MLHLTQRHVLRKDRDARSGTLTALAAAWTAHAASGSMGSARRTASTRAPACGAALPGRLERLRWFELPGACLRDQGHLESVP